MQLLQRKALYLLPLIPIVLLFIVAHKCFIYNGLTKCNTLLYNYIQAQPNFLTISVNRPLSLTGILTTMLSLPEVSR